MGTVEIFITQLSMSILVFSLLAKWVVWPWLNEKTVGIALMILVAPHTIRHIGLTFLVPSVTDPAISQNFALLTAWGDFTAGVLAILVLFALRHHWKMARPLLWLFNILGSLDLLKALSNPDVVPTLAGTWYIPTFWVPVLLVSHAMIFILLVKGKNKLV
jgi:hypothetical protein